MSSPSPQPSEARKGGLRFLYVAAALVIVCGGLKSAQDIVVQFLLALFLEHGGEIGSRPDEQEQNGQRKASSAIQSS